MQIDPCAALACIKCLSPLLNPITELHLTVFLNWPLASIVRSQVVCVHTAFIKQGRYGGQIFQRSFSGLVSVPFVLSPFPLPRGIL